MCVCVCVCVRVCVCVCVCVCVFVSQYYYWKQVPSKWQAWQAIPAILQVRSSKHYTKIQVCACVYGVYVWGKPLETKFDVDCWQLPNKEEAIHTEEGVWYRLESETLVIGHRSQEVIWGQKHIQWSKEDRYLSSLGWRRHRSWSTFSEQTCCFV